MPRHIFTRQSFAPKGAIKIRHRESGAEVYIYDTPKGVPCAVAFSGKRQKPDFNISYRTTERRESHIKEYFTNLMKSYEFKASRKAEEKAFRHSYQPGDILLCSWGYDQTNVNFYQVSATTEHTVTIREIAQESIEGSEGFMCDYRVPVKDQFIGNPEVRRVRGSKPGDAGYITGKYGSCSRWNGSPAYCSWYA